MISPSYVVALLISLVLLGVAGFFGWRQVVLFRRLRTEADLSPEDRSYLRNQAWRRLICSGFMVILAGLLAGTFISGQEKAADDLGDLIQARLANQELENLTPEQEQFRQRYARYWMAVLLLLLAILMFAALDFWAIRRYALRHRQQIQDDRRAMLESQLARLRSQRNGPG